MDREILTKFLRVEMPDGTRWDVPVQVIAKSRATYYAEVDEVSFTESLEEDTLPLFAGDEYYIMDWASGSMDWADVKEFALQAPSVPADYQEGWINGPMKVVAAGERLDDK